MSRTCIALFALLLAAPRPGSAQDPRLSRLDGETRAAVAATIDSAGAAGLPVEPLVQRALEGATKGAPGARITAAVRRLAADLASARFALGEGVSAAEVEAGAAALRAGAGPAVLARVRTVRRPPLSLTMALAVLADLVATGVPVDSAAAAVLALAATARDADLVEFRRAVERDIALGAPPASAAGDAAAEAVRLQSGDATSSPSQPRPRRP